MTVGYASAIGSHVGMVRSNNQDSAFAGDRLFLVADGMGGHAGGDVASAMTTRELAKIDAATETGQLDLSGTPVPPTPEQARERASLLADHLLRTNQLLRRTVGDRPELSGMGTTFTGFLTVGERLALAHIGDSRLYLLRDGEFRQVTVDHTFVQRLVDSGRITEEEAKTHPRRSVLMRVLGDVDSSPEIDTEVLETRPGDLWVLCSDGLCGYVDDTETEKILKRRGSLQGAVDQLIDAALAHGAPDNVTVVLVETLSEPLAHEEAPGPRFAGSATTESDPEETRTARTRLLSRRRIIRRAQPVAESHFEPRVDEYLAELIAETRRRTRNRRIVWAVGLLAVAAVLVGSLVLAYQWTQTLYYVGTDGDTVIIYQGVQQSLGGLSLSSEAENTGIPLDSLDGLEQRQVQRTLNAGSLAEAREIVLRLGVEE